MDSCDVLFTLTVYAYTPASVTQCDTEQVQADSNPTSPSPGAYIQAVHVASCEPARSTQGKLYLYEILLNRPTWLSHSGQVKNWSNVLTPARNMSKATGWNQNKVGTDVYLPPTVSALPGFGSLPVVPSPNFIPS
ncbi:hypothetical protein E2C01_023348 [Portunus trituberculatus]|uniref:Uncharacterized protein n=1 Tax=Portunus trituberculatus TaxID=210409 RepID=A0A5B7E7S5_PORTR|nr:hypothetical protein [Portunus trituberculatus]